MIGAKFIFMRQMGLFYAKRSIFIPIPCGGENPFPQGGE
jgi:hypothetical protein